MLCLILIISLSLSRRDIKCTTTTVIVRTKEARQELSWNWTKTCPLEILNLDWGSFTSLIVLIPSALLTPNYENKPQSYHCSPFPVIYHTNTWLYANIACLELEKVVSGPDCLNDSLQLSEEECKQGWWPIIIVSSGHSLRLTVFIWRPPTCHYRATVRATVSYLGQMSATATQLTLLVTGINTVTD